MKFSVLIALSALLFGTATTMASASDPSYKVIKKVPLGGEGAWDYLTVDSAHSKLYVARFNRVMVIDTDSNKLINTILPEGSPQGGIHGIAIVPDVERGYFTSGKDGSVRFFDLKKQEEKGSITVGEGPDAIIYEPNSKMIFCFNHKGGTVSIIDPQTNKVTSTIELNGEPEAGVSDENGHVFVNLEDKSEIAVIDTAKMAVSARYPVAPGAQPSGLAIDTAHHRLFSGCHNQNLVILDSESGKVVGTVPIGAKNDGCAFDATTQTAFASNGAGTMTVIREDDPNTFRVIDNVETQKGSKTMALDAKTHKIYLATNERETKPGSTAQRVIPDSFALLIIGQ